MLMVSAPMLVFLRGGGEETVVFFCWSGMEEVVLLVVGGSDSGGNGDGDGAVRLTSHVGGAVVVRRQSAERVGAHGPHVLLDVSVCHHLVLLTLVGMLQRVRATDHRRTEVPARGREWGIRAAMGTVCKSINTYPLWLRGSVRAAFIIC